MLAHASIALPPRGTGVRAAFVHGFNAGMMSAVAGRGADVICSKAEFDHELRLGLSDLLRLRRHELHLDWTLLEREAELDRSGHVLGR